MQQATVPGHPQASPITTCSLCRCCVTSSSQQSLLAAQPFVSHSSGRISHPLRLPSRPKRQRATARRLPPAAALSGDSMQDFIVGSSLATAIGAAIFYGTKVNTLRHSSISP